MEWDTGEVKMKLRRKELVTGSSRAASVGGSRGGLAFGSHGCSVVAGRLSGMRQRVRCRTEQEETQSPCWRGWGGGNWEVVVVGGGYVVFPGGLPPASGGGHKGRKEARAGRWR